VTLCKNIVSCYLLSEPFACYVKPTTISQHLLMTRSTEYREIQKDGLNKLQQQKSQFKKDVHYIPKKNCTEKPA